MSIDAREQENNRSSLFDKLPDDLRRRLDLAIVHRIPPTFKAVWMQFELAKFGVSFSALYRYARRLRDRINLAEAVLIADDDQPDIDAAIQKLLSRRVLELLMHTGAADCAREIAALVSASRKGARTAHDLCRLELDREHLRLKSEALDLSRRALENRPAKALRLARTEHDTQPEAKSASPSAPELACRLADAE